MISNLSLSYLSDCLEEHDRKGKLLDGVDAVSNSVEEIVNQDSTNISIPSFHKDSLQQHQPSPYLNVLGGSKDIC